MLSFLMRKIHRTLVRRPIYYRRNHRAANIQLILMCPLPPTPAGEVFTDQHLALARMRLPQKLQHCNRKLAMVADLLGDQTTTGAPQDTTLCTPWRCQTCKHTCAHGC